MLTTPHLSSSPEHAAAAPGPPAAQNSKKLSVTLQSSTYLSVSVKETPLALVQQTALRQINELLASQYGVKQIETAIEVGIDTGPAATAERIVSMSTGLFHAYRAGKPDMSDQEALESFMEVIGQGIEQGFAEAREILAGLQVLNGGVAEDIDRTYELVQRGLADFMAQAGAGPDDGSNTQSDSTAVSDSATVRKSSS